MRAPRASRGPGAAPRQLLAAKAGQIVKILRARLKKSGAVITNAQFRVHLYGAAPTVTNGDNGVWLSTESSYLGHFDVTIDKAFSAGSSGVGVPGSGLGTFALYKPAASVKNIFALLEARAAYTPISGEVFTLSLEAETE